MSEVNWTSPLLRQASPGSPCLYTPRAKELTPSNGTMVATSTMGQVCMGESLSWAGPLRPWVALALDGSDIRKDIPSPKSSGLRPFYG